MYYEAVADLPLTIESFELQPRERETSSGFTRSTTVVTLSGNGVVGRGEDVTYEAKAHDRFRNEPGIDPHGEYTIDDFSDWLADQDLFSVAPGQAIFRNYRRWSFESAALDLALKQAGTTLGSRLNRSLDPVRFIVSTRLGDPPTADRVLGFLERDTSLEFKLDPTSDWTVELLETLAETGAVRSLDLKGQYQGTSVDQPADPALYRQVIETFPDALIEDPALTEETRPLFAGHEDRVTWDYPIHGEETIEELPWAPAWLNIKPSRFGSVRSLFATIAYCQHRGIRLFGGGQFELDVGRSHLHTLASLFYPDAPNDVAPRGYNDSELSSDLPSSPLEPPGSAAGFSW